MYKAQVTNNLIGVLLRFRQGNIGHAADVEAMFHQVRVRRQDQNVLRFLWWTDSYDDPPDVYVMNVHIFGTTSSPCVASFALDELQMIMMAISTQVLLRPSRRVSMLMMPCLSSVTSLPQSDLVSILYHSGFHLTKFMSNSNVMS